MGKYSDPNNPCANFRPSGEQCGHFVGNHTWTKSEDDRGACEVTMGTETCGCPEYVDSAPKSSGKPDKATKSEKPDNAASNGAKN